MPITLAKKTTADVLWTTRIELERMFGKSNITQWADVENTRNEETIRQNICAACEDATDEAKGVLQGGAAGTVVVASRDLRRNVTRIAAGLLYESRGVRDTSDEEGKNRLSTSVNRAQKWLRKVNAGVVRLTSGNVEPTRVPFVSPHKVPNSYNQRVTQECRLYQNEREEVMSSTTYPWFYGDGFDLFFWPTG
jgi:hypothetical protein